MGGFWYGTPASVAEVRVDELLRTSVTQSDTVYFVFPVADFRVGRFRLCAVDSRWPATPRVGGRVAVASLFPPANAARLFQLGLTPYEVFLEDDSGSTVPPSALARAGAIPGDLDFDTLLDLFRSLTSEREAQGGGAR